MSMDHVIYLQHNGEILRAFSGPSHDLVHQLADGEAAALGTGSWLTHRVVDGHVLQLDAPRASPFEGAHWDAQIAQWFDPLGRPETAAAARVDRRQILLRQIGEQEARQARPLREIEVVRALGGSAPDAAVAMLRKIGQVIDGLRAQLAALA